MRVFALLQLTLLSVLVSAHPGEEHEHVDEVELVERANAMHARSLKARNCANAIAEFELKRRDARLPFAKRQTTATSSAATPHYTTIQNTTCVTASEVTEGPYYINNEFIRTDLRETQTGVKLVLDIGVIDTMTCEPFADAFVELWHGKHLSYFSVDGNRLDIPQANSTGAYGGYIGAQGAATNINIDTFLRGGYFTNSEGIVEITTLYPGYYTGRTAHIHTMVHKNIEQNANGTVISKSGTLTHIGQFFFEETWNDEVFSQSPYTTTSQQRMTNDEDGILTSAGGVGFLSLSLLGTTISDGVLGYITVAVDSSQSYSINNENTLQGTLTGSSTAAGSTSRASTASAVTTSRSSSSSSTASAADSATTSSSAALGMKSDMGLGAFAGSLMMVLFAML
ncbi:hypothetical protein NLJ89_g5453 [Agrocybe chaxingu]|uniref:Intradiol ring-cleavage dioxygenases domain-containing protein n=1 Tax=Agrocybe chaxingu TaxID=84603 RepID=A0A9W8K100_9AGAR|nr:hypothetical protein NLJ89_g5453 [Agrocybe chaxingu]